VYLDLLCDVGRLRYTLQKVRSLCVFRAAAAKSAWNEMCASGVFRVSQPSRCGEHGGVFRFAVRGALTGAVLGALSLQRDQNIATLRLAITMKKTIFDISRQTCSGCAKNEISTLDSLMGSKMMRNSVFSFLKMFTLDRLLSRFELRFWWKKKVGKISKSKSNIF
jgi:hypothetical protein